MSLYWSASEGEEASEELRRLRWRVNLLEKQKLQLTSSSNQEVCGLQAVTRLRSAAERAEAQRVELQYQRAVSHRDAERIAELKTTGTNGRSQETVEELKKALQMTAGGQGGDQNALQQEVEERDQLIQSFSSENQRLHGLLQEQEEALKETERRMVEVQTERVKEAELIRKQNEELKYLTEREERSHREKEAVDQRVRSLAASVEAERAAHLESKFNSEVVQLRLRDLEAAVAVERSSQQEAQASLELLRAQFREVERALSLERERGGSTERALQRLQTENAQFQADNRVALENEKKVTSDLSERLEEEKRRHTNTHSLLEEATKRQRDTEETFLSVMRQIRDALKQARCTDERSVQPAMDAGNPSPAEVMQLLTTTLNSYQRRLEDSDKQVQGLVSASQKLQEENWTLQQLTSDQTRRIHESQQVLAKLQEEVTRLHQETSDWSMQSKDLQVELQKEKEKRQKEKEKQREERAEEIQKMTEQYTKESKDHLTFLHCLYQRLLAGCVLLDHPQSILGNFTWKELCDVIKEQVDELTADLRKANEKVTHLKSVCRKKSVCVRELQRSQECVLSRLEERVRRREEAWSEQHTHTVKQLQSELQLCRSQMETLRDQGSSLERRCSSLTSELSRLQDLLSRRHHESSSFFTACALLAGALRHAHHRLCALAEQKTLLSRRLVERELLEEEVKKLADALEGEKDKKEKENERRRSAARRWRRSVGVVVALRRWRALSKKTAVIFRLDGGAAVCVCAALPAATETDQEVSPTTEEDEGSREGVCARWLCSRRLSSIVLSSMSDLQGALKHTGASPPNVILAARSALSRLLYHLLDQSESSISLGGADKVKTTPPQIETKTLVSALQQHFLLFSQRLHSAEVERRGLRLQVANLKRGLKEKVATVAAERFHAVCQELCQALSREQEAQILVQQQTEQLLVLQQRVDAHAGEQTHNIQELAEARQEVSRKESSLRILGKHLSGVQKKRKLLEERLRRAEDELSDAARRHESLIRCMKAAETSCKQVRDELVQSQPSLSAQPHSLPLPEELLELGGAESIMGAPEVAACQSFLSVVSQLRHTCRSRIDWLQQEVSAHHSHVTALRSELQDACLRDNQVFVPVEEFPETSLFDDVGKA
ncbi:LOW QUALITY PROTEIN: coiled-coil domain-containing protein 171 [Xenentodon cancila]